MDRGLLDDLLRGRQVQSTPNVWHRFWSARRLRFEDLVQYLAAILRKEQWFPVEWDPEKVGETGVIECHEDFYVFRKQGFPPLNPRRRVRFVEKSFWSAEDAARHYLRVE